MRCQLYLVLKMRKKELRKIKRNKQKKDYRNGAEIQCTTLQNHYPYISPLRLAVCREASPRKCLWLQQWHTPIVDEPKNLIYLFNELEK